jgi:hypothetical protein
LLPDREPQRAPHHKRRRFVMKPAMRKHQVLGAMVALGVAAVSVIAIPVAPASAREPSVRFQEPFLDYLVGFEGTILALPGDGGTDQYNAFNARLPVSMTRTDPNEFVVEEAIVP